MLVTPETRQEMFQQNSHETFPTFCDVAAGFSEDEWTLLQHWQQELYNSVMKEIQQAFSSLGPLIASSVFSLRPKEINDLCSKNNQQLEIISSIDPSSSEITAESSALYKENQNLKNTEEWESCDGLNAGEITAESCALYKENQNLKNTEEWESCDGLNAGYETTRATISVSIKEEEATAMAYQGPQETIKISCPTVSASLGSVNLMAGDRKEGCLTVNSDEKMDNAEVLVGMKREEMWAIEDPDGTDGWESSDYPHAEPSSPQPQNTAAQATPADKASSLATIVAGTKEKTRKKHKHHHYSLTAPIIANPAILNTSTMHASTECTTNTPTSVTNIISTQASTTVSAPTATTTSISTLPCTPTNIITTAYMSLNKLSLGKHTPIQHTPHSQSNTHSPTNTTTTATPTTLTATVTKMDADLTPSPNDEIVRRIPATMTRAVPMGNLRSWVWDYFDVPYREDVKTARIVICTICLKELQRGDPAKYSLGTGCMLVHMRLVHNKIFRQHTGRRNARTTGHKRPTKRKNMQAPKDTDPAKSQTPRLFREGDVVHAPMSTTKVEKEYVQYDVSCLQYDKSNIFGEASSPSHIQTPQEHDLTYHRKTRTK
ncbi:serine-rich adhesin for platelets-like isoform X2 [Ambystoma mexicanum]|uniref:serine-rich adhesin for platelets-like isoform X2 n=1 Tax=Ambystoma mexicanum TaxID=8296 RepID=UPI0037E9A419